jgi:hypothetical protein
LPNLSIQQGRLRRQAEKDPVALQALQQLMAVRRNEHQQFDPKALGFEFTVEQIEVRAIEIEPDLVLDWAIEQQ